MLFVSVAALLLFVIGIIRGDTDLPQIPEYITIHKVIRDWDEAYLQCNSEGAVLASPINTELLNIMKSLIGVNNTPYFIGTRSNENSRLFTSVEGIPLQNMTAAMLQMIKQLDPELGNCLSMDMHSIRAVPCWKRLPFLCYKAVPYSTRMVNASMHANDTLPIWCETEGYKYNVMTGSCYKFHRELKAWDEAVATCAVENGHLVVIDDEVEAKVIKDMVIGHSYPYTHIGFKDYSGHNYWKSVNGKLLADIYHVWEFNDASGRGYFCGVIRPTGMIDNYPCHLASDFICERSRNI